MECKWNKATKKFDKTPFQPLRILKEKVKARSDLTGTLTKKSPTYTFYGLIDKSTAGLKSHKRFKLDKGRKLLGGHRQSPSYIYIYIYIVSHRQTVLLYHNPSVWLHTKLPVLGSKTSRRLYAKPVNITQS